MQNKKLYKYIKSSLDEGFEKEVIRNRVINSGYNHHLVDDIFRDIEAPKKKWFGKRVKFQIGDTQDINNRLIPLKPTPTNLIDKEELKQADDPHPIIIKPTKDDKGQGLKSTLEQVNSKLDLLTNKDDKKAYKEFKLPSKIKRQLKKLALKSKILVILLTRNRGMIPLVTEIRDGFVNIEGTPHQCAVDQVFLWKGKYPAMVIPEWDIRPIGTQDYYEAVKNHTIADPIAIAIRMMENKEMIMKNKLSPKAWIFIGLAVIAGLYVLFGMK